MRARTTTALALATIALALTGCSKAQPAPSAPSTTPIEVTRAQAYKAADQSIRTWVAVRATNPRTLKGTKAEGVTTASFRASEDKATAAVLEGGNRLVGGASVKSLKPASFAISPTPVTVMDLCFASDGRVLDANGQDVTVTPDGKPAPQGVRTTSGLVSLVPSLSGNGTWLIDTIQWQGGPC